LLEVKAEARTLRSRQTPHLEVEAEARTLRSRQTPHLEVEAKFKEAEQNSVLIEYLTQ